MQPKYHLLLQPFDCEPDFLETFGSVAVSLYPRIKNFDFLPQKKLEVASCSVSADELSKTIPYSKMTEVARDIIRRDEPMIDEDKTWVELKKHWSYNPHQLFVGIVPYAVFDYRELCGGVASINSKKYLNMAIVSIHDLRDGNLSKIGILYGLHEIGHLNGLGHCMYETCVMGYRPNIPDDGVYKLCWEDRVKVGASRCFQSADSAKEYITSLSGIDQSVFGASDIGTFISLSLNNSDYFVRLVEKLGLRVGRREVIYHGSDEISRVYELLRIPDTNIEVNHLIIP